MYIIFIYIHVYICILTLTLRTLSQSSLKIKNTDLTVASEVNEPFRYQCLAEAFWCCKGLACRRTSVATKNGLTEC